MPQPRFDPLLQAYLLGFVKKSRLCDTYDRSMTRPAFSARVRAIRGRAMIRREYNGLMELRRRTFGAAVKLAMALSVVATAIALGLDAVGGFSQTALVLTVMVVGFVASWVQTGRVSRSTAPHAAHRLTVVPLRQPVA